MRDQDAKIAEWFGFQVNKSRDHNFLQERYNYDIVSGKNADNMPHVYPVPEYTNSDSDAVWLISALSKLKYKCILESSVTGDNVGYIFEIKDDRFRYCSIQPTIHEAICDVVLKLIEREAENSYYLHRLSQFEEQ